MRDLPATIFWRDTTRAIGCDLDTVNAIWRKQMQSLYETVDVSRYPVFSDITMQRDPATGQVRIRARLAAAMPDEQGDGMSEVQGEELGDAIGDARDGRQDAGTGVRQDEEFTVPERFIVRIGGITTQLAGGVDPVFRGRLIDEGEQVTVEFLVPDYAIPGQRFRYQLGFTPSPDARYYYESWRRGTAPTPGSAGES
jgi:hypothetical protein